MSRDAREVAGEIDDEAVIVTHDFTYLDTETAAAIITADRKALVGEIAAEARSTSTGDSVADEALDKFADYITQRFGGE